MSIRQVLHCIETNRNYVIDLKAGTFVPHSIISLHAILLQHGSNVVQQVIAFSSFISLKVFQGLVSIFHCLPTF